MFTFLLYFSYSFHSFAPSVCTSSLLFLPTCTSSDFYVNFISGPDFILYDLNVGSHLKFRAFYVQYVYLYTLLAVKPSRKKKTVELLVRYHSSQIVVFAHVLRLYVVGSRDTLHRQD